MSKGSKQRPCDKDKFNEEFDRIFGKPKDKKELAREAWEKLGKYMVGENERLK